MSHQGYIDNNWAYERIRLNRPTIRYIKRKEKELGRKCRKIWSHTNRLGETFLFANFCKNYDKVIVTIAYFDPRVRLFLPPR